jgi:hypothetical protein
MKSNDVESGTNELSFLFQVFFMNHLPQAQKTTLGSFQIFAKFADIFASQGAPPVTNLSPVSTGVNYIGGKLPQVSMTPTVNLLPVSTPPVANTRNNIRLLTP